MKNHQNPLKLSAVALAVLGALSAMPAFADDAEALALKTPSNSIEVGVGQTSVGSAKFGEYNGMNASGQSFVGNVDMRGGNAYGNATGTQRWSVQGNNVFLNNRDLKATYAEQGTFNFGFLYDELHHVTADTFQTPYIGTNGGNNFTLPSNFGFSTNAQVMTPAQLAAMHNLGVENVRKNTGVNVGVGLGTGWDLRFDYNRLDQSGAKLQAVPAAKVGLATGEVVEILPFPTNARTDTFNLALAWTGQQGHATASYYGSYFNQNIDRFTMDTWGGTGNTFGQITSTAPSNKLHQYNLSGGYAFTPTTKLAGSLSYSRNTQNDPFVYDSYFMVTPITRTSLNGEVINTHADLKLTNQFSRNLTLSAGFKRDDRDNRTTSYIYNFNAISGGNTANYPSTPLSVKKDQFQLAADWRIKSGHSLNVGLDHEEISRKCNSYAVNAGYPAGTNCVVAVSSKEDKLNAIYKVRMGEGADVKVGYTYSDRKTTNDLNARAAVIGTNGNAPSPAIPGVNAGDFPGFYPYFDASRMQHAFKLNSTVQAGDRLTLLAGGKFTGDSYNSNYGVLRGYSWSANLDATFAYSDNGALSAYVTQQHRQRDLVDQQRAGTVGAATATALGVPANGSWTNYLRDDDVTVGLGLKQGGLWGNKLDLNADLTLTQAVTSYSTRLNYAGVNLAGADCTAAYILSCGQLPDIKTSVAAFKLVGTYALDKNSKVVARWVHQKMSSTDYFYNGYQAGFTPTTLWPTNQQAPNYQVNVVSLSYLYNF